MFCSCFSFSFKSNQINFLRQWHLRKNFSLFRSHEKQSSKWKSQLVNSSLTKIYTLLFHQIQRKRNEKKTNKRGKKCIILLMLKCHVSQHNNRINMSCLLLSNFFIYWVNWWSNYAVYIRIYVCELFASLHFVYVINMKLKLARYVLHDAYIIFHTL